MEFNNHKITEAVCAFRFSPDNNNWDITSFAAFYNVIKDFGFSKKNEIKPVQLSFQFKANETPTTPQMTEGDTQMVFKNEDESKAILLGNNYISFHTINNYPGWNIFLISLIEEFLEKYFKIGYGKDLLSVQMIYINSFELETNSKLSDYLTFVPNMENFGEGEELSHVFQSVYNIAPNKRLQLKTIFNVIEPQKIKKVVLECNCIAFNDSKKEIHWKILANDAHDNARNSFVKISTAHFKEIIL